MGLILWKSFEPTQQKFVCIMSWLWRKLIKKEKTKPYVSVRNIIYIYKQVIQIEVHLNKNSNNNNKYKLVPVIVSPSWVISEDVFVYENPTPTGDSKKIKLATVTKINNKRKIRKKYYSFAQK